MSASFTIIRLPQDHGAQTVTFLGSCDALAEMFRNRQSVPDTPQLHPEVANQILYVRVMFTIRDFHLGEVVGIWTSPDNRVWNCALNQETLQIGLVEASGKKQYYLNCAPPCLRRAVEGALEKAAMRRLRKNPELFPKTHRGEGQ